MAELVSPGVSISVNDESFYASAGAGTVPLLIIATAQDKSSPDGSGTSAFTSKAQAGKLKLITSQRELLQNYGNPLFYSSGSTALNGYDLNEYGLLAAHSFLGLANRAFIVRADIDLGQLAATATAPTGAIADGSYWFDTASSKFGLREWSGTAWVKKSVSVVDKINIRASGAPSQAFGLNGDYAVVANTAAGGTASAVKYYEKYSDDWQEVGSASWVSATSSDFQFGTHLAVPTLQSDGVTSLSTGDIFIQRTTPNTGADLSVKLYSLASKSFSAVATPFYANTDTAYTTIGTANVTVGQVVAVHGTSASLELKRHNGKSTNTGTGATKTSIDVSGNSSIDIVYNGATVVVTLTGSISSTPATSTVEDAVFDINSALAGAGISEVVASQGSDTNVVLVSSTGRDIAVNSNHADFGPSSIGFGSGAATVDVVFSNFGALSYEASKLTITGTLAENTYWYDAAVSLAKTDILENDASAGWQTLSTELLVASTAPSVQADGTALVNGDVWLDSDDTENYPALYKRASSKWVKIDGKDQVTAEGIIYADFRQTKTSALDADAPLRTAYPQGMIAFNKRASSGSVKQYKINYTPAATNIGNVWVDASKNQVDGKMFGLRKAVHNVVKVAMQSAIVSNDDLRAETNSFNLIASPGFPELLDEMVALSGDRRNTAFVIGDTPFRLKADATSTKNWATNANTASENGEDGLLTSSPYAAVYYPSALSTNLDGTNVVVPASHVALRTLAYNDQVAFPWFAPAGFQRGLVQNATSVGYVNATDGEYTPVSLNEGQRDNLYLNKVNPIASFPGRGLVVFGQKTLNPVASALDRINVARLVVHIRERLDDIVKPFLFEPNDDITRQNAKGVVDSFLSNLVVQRGLFDYVTVCDGSNNTPTRIDRNELYIDIAIQPVKAIEFIYIPIRIQNTLGSTAS